MGQPLKLDLTNNPIAQGDDFDTVLKAFYNHFGISGATYFPERNYEPIQFASLAATIHTSLNNYLDSNKPNNTFLRGIRFYLGLEHINSDTTQRWHIRLIVVPVCLDSVVVSGWPSCHFNYTPSDPLPQSAQIYIIENGMLAQTTWDHANTLMTNYYNNISILHTDEDIAFTSYNPATDVKSVFFSFQEIEELYYDNLNSSTPIENDTVYLFSIGVQNQNNGIYQHTLGIVPNISHSPFNGTFVGKVADLANLCPPHCATAVIKINSQTLLGTIQQ